MRQLPPLDLWAAGLCRDGDAGLRRNAHAATPAGAPPASNLPAAPPTAPLQHAGRRRCHRARLRHSCGRRAAEWRPDAGRRSREGRARLGRSRTQIWRRGSYRTLRQYFRLQQATVYEIQIPNAVNLFKAEHDRYPKDWAEFKREILDPASIQFARPSRRASATSRREAGRIDGRTAGALRSVGGHKCQSNEHWDQQLR